MRTRTRGRGRGGGGGGGGGRGLRGGGRRLAEFGDGEKAVSSLRCGSCGCCCDCGSAARWCVGGCSCGSRLGCAVAASPSGCSRRAASPKLSAPCSAAHRHLALLHLRRLEPLRTRWAPKLAAVGPERTWRRSSLLSRRGMYDEAPARAQGLCVRLALHSRLCTYGLVRLVVVVEGRIQNGCCTMVSEVCLCGVQKSRARYPRCDVYPVKSSTISHV